MQYRKMVYLDQMMSIMVVMEWDVSWGKTLQNQEKYKVTSKHLSCSFAKKEIDVCYFLVMDPVQLL